jgi:hypothetical protein
MNRRNFLRGLLAAPAVAVLPAIAAPCTDPIDPKPEEKTATEIANRHEHGAVTNFAEIEDWQKELWSKALWKDAREQNFYMNALRFQKRMDQQALKAFHFYRGTKW